MRLFIAILHVSLISASIAVSGFWLTSPKTVNYDVLTRLVTTEFRSSMHTVVTLQRQLSQKEVAEVCKALKLSKGQLRICLSDWRIAATMLRAADSSTTECRSAFMFEMWNCSLGIHRVNMLQKGFKERSYLQTITGASLAYAFAQSCRYKEMKGRCRVPRGRFKKEKRQRRIPDRQVSYNDRSILGFSGGRFSDNFKYGHYQAGKILGTSALNSIAIDELSTVHNYKLGIKLLKKFYRKECHCLNLATCGRNGKRECIYRLGDFSEIAQRIKRQYRRSVKAINVTFSQHNKAYRIMKETRTPKSWEMPRAEYVKRKDLVYLEETPNICSYDARQYFASPSGRVCYDDGLTNDTQNSPENCKSFCCRDDRGNYYIAEEIKYKGICKETFRWCCWVQRVYCDKIKHIYRCVDWAPRQIN